VASFGYWQPTFQFNVGFVFIKQREIAHHANNGPVRPNNNSIEIL